VDTKKEFYLRIQGTQVQIETMRTLIGTTRRGRDSRLAEVKSELSADIAGELEPT
jgi:hypothetical protein